MLHSRGWRDGEQKDDETAMDGWMSEPDGESAAEEEMHGEWLIAVLRRW